MFLPGYQIPLSLFLISWNCNISYRRTNGMIFFWKSIIVKSVDSCLYFLMFYWIIYFNNFMFNYFLFIFDSGGFNYVYFKFPLLLLLQCYFLSDYLVLYFYSRLFTLIILIVFVPCGVYTLLFSSFWGSKFFLSFVNSYFVFFCDFAIFLWLFLHLFSLIFFKVIFSDCFFLFIVN